MLLQELQRDTKTLLKTTGATREELDEFTRFSGIDLGEILYSQSKYNLFVKWLQHHQEIETSLMFVNIAMIEYLVDKHEKGQQYATSEKMNCYAYDKNNNQYIFCENKSGICRTYGIVL